ncbi:MAG: tetratricopeptide repeat protein [Deltaproteobacteria bacterium]|nr:tetratricopeptide repeat protein [Deltaproteobacteria bacterium]
MVPAPPDPAAAPDAHGWRARLRLILSLGGRGLLVLLSGAADAQADALVALVAEADAPGGPAPVVRVAFGPGELLAAPIGARVIVVQPERLAGWLNENRPVVTQRRLTMLLWCAAEQVAELRRLAPDFIDWVSHRVEVPPTTPAYVAAAIAAVQAHGGVLGLSDAPEAPPAGWRAVGLGLPYVELRAACAAGPLWVRGVSSIADWLKVRVAHSEAGRPHGLVVVNPTVRGVEEAWVDGRPIPWAEAAQALRARGEENPGLSAAQLGLDPAALGLPRATPPVVDTDPRWAALLAAAARGPDGHAAEAADLWSLPALADAWEAEGRLGTDPAALRWRAARAMGRGDYPAAEAGAQAAIDAAAEAPGERAWSALLLVDLQLMTGRLGEAEALLDTVVAPGFAAAGDPRGEVEVLDRRAQLALARGAPDEALRLWSDEVLPAYERLGDARSRAVTLYNIARIRVDKGEVDAALTLQTEALKLFERLGDARSRALTLGDIARIRVTRGEVDAALALHEEARAVFERLGDPRDRALALNSIARIWTDRGEVDRALALHAEALATYERLGDARERAVTLGYLARIRREKGEVDAALALHEDALATYERLGDVRERAVTLGDIAHIRLSKGEVEAALALHHEQLAAFERLGDARGQAVALASIARIRLSKGEVEAALALLEELRAVFERLGDARSRAVTLGDIARIRAGKGEVDAALALHEERLAVLERLGDARSRAVTLGDIARIRADRGEIDTALALHEERLAVFERLGDVRERAVTLGDIARTRVSKGQLTAALALHEQQLAVVERLGDARERAVTLGDIARIRVNKGEVDAALALHEEQLAVYERLGDARSRAVTLGEIARIRGAQGELEAAIALLEEALAVFERLGDARGRVATLHDLGGLALRGRRAPLALTYWSEAWRRAQELGAADVLAAVGADLGALLAEQGHPQAGGVLRIARAAAQRLGWRPHIEHIDKLRARLENPLARAKTLAQAGDHQGALNALGEPQTLPERHLRAHLLTMRGEVDGARAEAAQGLEAAQTAGDAAAVAAFTALLSNLEAR